MTAPSLLPLPPSVIRAPRSDAEIVAELRRVHAESVAYWADYPAIEFFRRPAPDVWAPADQVRHLTKSMRGIVVGFAMPKVLLMLRYGIALRPSRAYEDIRADYEAVLRRGANAGRFAPRALDAAEQTADGRERVMREHAEAVEHLCAALAQWSEWSLERFIIPHPALGRLTAREMAMFALLHNVHHVHVAERRRAAT